MVREDEQHRLIVDRFQHPADQRVGAAVHFLDRRPIAAVRRASRRTIRTPVKHMLDSIRGVEHATAHSRADALDRIEEHLFPFAMNGIRLVEERLLVDSPFAQGPGVLGQPQRGERPVQLGQIGGVIGRMRDWHRRPLRVDVDRRHVQCKLGGHRSQQKPADAADLPQPATEFHPHPVRTDPGFQPDLLPGDVQHRRVGRAVETHFQRNTQTAFAHGGARQRRAHAPVFDRDRNPCAAGGRSLIARRS